MCTSDRFNKARKIVNPETAERVRVYRYTGTADDLEKTDGDVGYDLLPLYNTMWARPPAWRVVPGSRRAVRRHFPSVEMSTAYVHQPFLGVLRN